MRLFANCAKTDTVSAALRPRPFQHPAIGGAGRDRAGRFCALASVLAATARPLNADQTEPCGLAGCSWIAFDAPARDDHSANPPSLAAVLDELRALPLAFGRRYRSGFLARRSAEDLEPFRILEAAVRNAALGRNG